MREETVRFRHRWPGIELDPLVPDGMVECCWDKAEFVQVTGLLVCINHETRDDELRREKRKNDDCPIPPVGGAAGGTGKRARSPTPPSPPAGGAAGGGRR